MKCALLFIVLLGGIVSCQRKSSHTGTFLFEPPTDTFDISKMDRFMMDSLSPAIYDSLDYSRKIVSTPDTGMVFYIRFPFKGIPIFKKFILIKVDETGKVMEGASFQIDETMTLRVAARTIIASGACPESFNGTITKTWLNGQVIYTSIVASGFIQALHPVPKDSVFNDQRNATPEIQLQSHLYACEIYHFSPEALLGPGGD